MSVAIPTLEEIRAAFREEIAAALAAARATEVDHSPTDELSTKEAADKLDIGVSAVEKRLKSKPPTLRGEKRGGRWVILYGDLCSCPSCAAWRKANGR